MGDILPRPLVDSGADACSTHGAVRSSDRPSAEERMEELREHLGPEPDDLDLDLGPLGRLL